MDLQQYAADFRDKWAALKEQFPDGDCYVMSVYNREKNSTAGNVCQVNVKLAASLLNAGTHRLATAEEVAAANVELEKRHQKHQADGLVNVARTLKQALDDAGMQVPPQPAASEKPRKS